MTSVYFETPRLLGKNNKYSKETLRIKMSENVNYELISNHFQVKFIDSFLARAPIRLFLFIE